MFKILKYIKSLLDSGDYGRTRILGIFQGINIFNRKNRSLNINIIKPEGGQVLTEFTVLLVMFIGVALTLMLLLAIFTEYGWRIVSLVALDYP